MILSLLPFLTFVAFYFLNRSYVMMLFNDPVGLNLLTGGIISIVIGIMVMKKMVKIEV